MSAVSRKGKPFTKPQTSRRHREPLRARQPRDDKLRSLLESTLDLKLNRVMTQPVGKRELPRLSGALRVFGRVSSDLSREAVSIDEALVRQKRQRMKPAPVDEKSWADLTSELLSSCSRSNEGKVTRATGLDDGLVNRLSSTHRRSLLAMIYWACISRLSMRVGARYFE